MNRRQFGVATAGLMSTGVSAPSKVAEAKSPTQVHPGIWQFRLGTPEHITPVAVRSYQPKADALRAMQPVAAFPLPGRSIAAESSARGFHVRLPLTPGEMIYGLGLQFQSVLQRGRKKTLRVNADPVADSGDSHAPVPFYVSNHGYGVLIDTARYLTIYCGNKVRKGAGRKADEGTSASAKVAQIPEAYGRYRLGDASEVLLEIPLAAGADIYVFGGPTMREAVQRYNLFSGGGPLPPRWGLGFWYRAYGNANQEQIQNLAEQFRAEGMPCDVLGFEPGWQTHSYSCSFRWSNKFPEPNRAVSDLAAKHFHVNLWEHPFTHPTAPIYQELLPVSGDFEVWEGLVPDFLDPKARAVFGGYHDRTFVANGISGFKLDECDNSDFTRSWSFPELSRFPSGVDGEQMHSLFGLRYQDTIQAGYQRRNLRTFGLVRSSGALATPSPYVLYSDLYDHREFIRGLVNSGFCGLLWCPEVRDATSEEDLIRRLQTTVFSPLTMVNAWYIQNPPWKQVDRAKNNAGEFADGFEHLQDICKRMVELRMQFLPYLYSAFVRYHESGVPPFRALVVDYPQDAKTWTLDDQYLMGESVLVAPVVAGQSQREVYLPAGEWFDFWSGKTIEGGRAVQVSVPLEQIPVFIKGGTLLPLAVPTLHTADPGSYRLEARGYGTGALATTLYEDDGTLRATLHPVNLRWPAGAAQGSVSRSHTVGGEAYTVTRWDRVGE